MASLAALPYVGMSFFPEAYRDQFTIDDGKKIVLLAQDREGYANLCRLGTRGRLRSAKGESKVYWREVREHAPGLLALSNGDAPLTELKDAFADRLYALVVENASLGADGLRSALLEGLWNHKGDAAQDDDVTLVVIEIG